MGGDRLVTIKTVFSCRFNLSFIGTYELKTNAEFSKFCIQAFHEMTHQFTDNLIDAQISMADDTHKLSEYLVILTDFYLFQKYNPSMLEDYCKLFEINECSEEIAKEKYPIPAALKEKMEYLLLQF